MPLCTRLRTTAQALRILNKQSFGHCQLRTKELEAQLSQLFNLPPLKENIQSQQVLQADIDEWRLRMELVWHQKSRETWLKVGDSNSKFFQASTVAKRLKNMIVAIKGDNGEWLESR